MILARKWIFNTIVNQVEFLYDQVHETILEEYWNTNIERNWFVCKAASTPKNSPFFLNIVNETLTA